MDKIDAGMIVTHYKHPTRRYEVVGVGKDSGDLEEVVIYKALFQAEFKFGTLWVRPLSEFIETLVIDGKEVERFREINE